MSGARLAAVVVLSGVGWLAAASPSVAQIHPMTSGSSWFYSPSHSLAVQPIRIAGSKPSEPVRTPMRRTRKTHPSGHATVLTLAIKETAMNAKTPVVAISLIVASLITASAASAAEPYKGEVMKVDAPAGKVTLTHGPIRKFDMEDGMTMVYRVKDPSMLTGLKAGDRITFDTDKINGRFTITEMKKAK